MGAKAISVNNFPFRIKAAASGTENKRSNEARESANKVNYQAAREVHHANTEKGFLVSNGKKAMT